MFLQAVACSVHSRLPVWNHPGLAGAILRQPTAWDALHGTMPCSRGPLARSHKTDTGVQARLAEKDASEPCIALDQVFEASDAAAGAEKSRRRPPGVVTPSLAASAARKRFQLACGAIKMGIFRFDPRNPQGSQAPLPPSGARTPAVTSLPSPKTHSLRCRGGDAVASRGPGSRQRLPPRPAPPHRCGPS